jgi:hypothetical protein
VRQRPPHAAPNAHLRYRRSNRRHTNRSDSSDSGAAEAAAEAEAEAAEAEAEAEAQQARSADPLPGRGGALDGGDGAWPRFGAVHAMEYNNFSAHWGEHHGSCSWCVARPTRA